MKKLEQYNVITLAYLGDAVYELYIRNHVIESGIDKVIEIQKEVTKYVSAKGQAKILKYLIENNILTPDEIEIVKRGRNYKRSSHPKNTDIITYKLSTGFETLIGWLYLNDNHKRINDILREVYNENIWKECE